MMKTFITALTITMTAFPGEDPKSATNPTVSTFRRTRYFKPCFEW